jgi:N utilization substance protein A
VGRIKYDLETMKLMSMFESVTRSKLKDCIISESLVTLVVEEGEIAKAVGKGGSNAKSLERKLNKKVRIVEFSDDLVKFIQNMTYPAKIKEVKNEEGIVTITPADSQSRGLLIGRGASILRSYEAIVKRFFDIQEIKVV